MAKHIVMCRLCKERFDVNDPSIESHLEGERSYYHKKCFEDWCKAATDPTIELTPEDYHNMSKDFLYKDVRMEVDWVKFESQWKTFLRPTAKPKMTAKGIYFSLYYYFNVRHGNKEKAQKGIGIVPYVYTESCQYWVEEEKRCAGIVAKIEAQAIARANQQQLIVKKVKAPRQKARFSLEEVEDS